MNKNRNGFQVMLGLIGMINPLLGVMCIAIIMGCIGNLMAIFITILGGAAIGNLLGEVTSISMKMIFVLLVVFGYCEEYFAMRNRQATIILHLNYLPESVIRYLPL